MVTRGGAAATYLSLTLIAAGSPLAAEMSNFADLLLLLMMMMMRHCHLILNHSMLTGLESCSKNYIIYMATIIIQNNHPKNSYNAKNILSISMATRHFHKRRVCMYMCIVQ